MQSRNGRDLELCEYLLADSACQGRDRHGSETGWASGGGSRRWGSGRSRCGGSWSLPA